MILRHSVPFCPLQVAEANVARFAKLYPMKARPAQQMNRRLVLQSC